MIQDLGVCYKIVGFSFNKENTLMNAKLGKGIWKMRMQGKL